MWKNYQEDGSNLKREDLIQELEHLDQKFRKLWQQEIKVKHRLVLGWEVQELAVWEVQVVLEVEVRGDHQ